MNTVASLMWDLTNLTRRASCSFESMQSGTEILVCWMLIKCSLKAFEIPTGLLICWPFTSIKEKLVGLGFVGTTCLSIDIVNRHMPIVKKRVKRKCLPPWMNKEVMHLIMLIAYTGTKDCTMRFGCVV